MISTAIPHSFVLTDWALIPYARNRNVLSHVKKKGIIFPATTVLVSRILTESGGGARTISPEYRKWLTFAGLNQIGVHLFDRLKTILLKTS